MLEPSFLTLSYIICAIVIFLFGTFILIKSPRNNLNLIYFLLCTSVSLWLFFYGITRISFNAFPLPSMLLTKLAYCGVTFIPIFTFHYLYIFTKREKFKYLLYLAYLFGFISSYFIFHSKLIIDGTNQFSWGLYPKAGRLHYIYLCLFFIFVFLNYLVVIKELSNEHLDYTKKNQSKYLILALSILSLT